MNIYHFHCAIRDFICQSQYFRTVPPESGGTSGWVILEALATLGGTLVIAVGAIVGARYARKANPSISGRALLRPDGSVVLVLQPALSSPGLLGIRFSKDEGHRSKVTVTEVLQSQGGLGDGAIYEAFLFDGEDYVGAGETVAETKVFHMPRPTDDLVGWRIQFFVDVGKLLRRTRWWSWDADGFVEVPTSNRL